MSNPRPNPGKAVRDPKSAVASILLSKTDQKCFLQYHLSCRVFQNIFGNVFAFVYVKVSSKEICEEISSSSVSIFLKIEGFFYRKNEWPPLVFFVDSNSPCNDHFFRVVLTFSRHRSKFNWTDFFEFKSCFYLLTNCYSLSSIRLHKYSKKKSQPEKQDS